MKYSKQREMIREAVVRHLDHPTADEVYTHLKPQVPALSLGTVYRNLNLLAENKEFLKLSMPGGCDRFDPNNYDHAHVLCQCCGRVFDYEMPQLPEIDRSVLEETGVLVSDHQLLFCGTCAECRERAEGELAGQPAQKHAG